MKHTSFIVSVLILSVFMIFGCASEKEKQLAGKWALASQLVGGGPSSYWFKSGGSVVAPWEDHKVALKSKGVYEFVNDKKLKIMLKSGYYKGNIYFFDIVKFSEDEIVFRNNFQEVKFKKKT